MKTIFIYPASSGHNQYISLIKNGFKKEGYTVFGFSKRSLLKAPLKKDLTFVNWIDNELIDKKGNFSYKGFLSILLKIVVMKILSKKLIFHKHNIYPHKTNPRCVGKVKKYIKFIEVFFDVKTSHSPVLCGQGYQYIPHPLYKDNISFQSDCGDYFLFFGSLVRYKNLEGLINAWTDKICLKICGFCNDQAYLKELIKLCSNKNIEIDARFISDDEAGRLVSNAKAIILPHSEPNMIVSGSFFYALTYGRPVIAVSNEFYVDIYPKFKSGGLYLLGSINELSNMNKADIVGPDFESNLFIKEINFKWIDDL